MGSKEQRLRTPLVDANSGMLSLSPDGSVNWPRTLRLAEFAYRDDVERVVVSAPQSCIDAFPRRMPHLAGLLAQHGMAMEVTSAIELTMSHDLFEQVVHTSTVLGGPLRRYVFLRIPRDTRLPIVPVVQALRRMKLTTILLAPERCARFQKDDLELRQIVSSGGLIQLSAASLLDQTDRTRVRLCRQLIRKQLCHVVATESGRHHDIPISLNAAYQVILRWEGAAVANALCRHNPTRIFDGHRVDAVPTQQRSVLNLFSRAA